MKTYKTFLFIVITSLFSSTLFGQVSVGINIGVPAPRYYYLQDIEAYFDIQASMYIFLSGGRWIHARMLPARYGHYDFDHGHKIIINDYHGSRPYNYYREHRSRFPKGHYENAGKNSWSPKHQKEQMKQNKKENKQFQKADKKQHKEYQKMNKQQNKHFQKSERNNNKGNGNANRSNGKGNGGGGGHGKGKK